MLVKEIMGEQDNCALINGVFGGGGGGGTGGGDWELIRKKTHNKNKKQERSSRPLGTC